MSSACSLLNYKKIFNLRARKFHFSWNIRFFFRADFFLFLELVKFPPEIKKINFPNYKKSFFWETIGTFLILGLESSISQNIRKTLFWENIKNIFREFFFLPFELGLKSGLGSPICSYWNSLENILNIDCKQTSAVLHVKECFKLYLLFRLSRFVIVTFISHLRIERVLVYY